MSTSGGNWRGLLIGILFAVTFVVAGCGEEKTECEKVCDRSVACNLSAFGDDRAACMRWCPSDISEECANCLETNECRVIDNTAVCDGGTCSGMAW